jgi:hypothetical protein
MYVLKRQIYRRTDKRTDGQAGKQTDGQSEPEKQSKRSFT